MTLPQHSSKWQTLSSKWFPTLTTLSEKYLRDSPWINSLSRNHISLMQSSKMLDPKWKKQGSLFKAPKSETSYLLNKFWNQWMISMLLKEEKLQPKTMEKPPKSKLSSWPKLMLRKKSSEVKVLLIWEPTLLQVGLKVSLRWLKKPTVLPEKFYNLWSKSSNRKQCRTCQNMQGLK